MKKKTGFFTVFPQKNPQLADPPQWFDTAAGRNFRGSSAETVELGCCYSVTTTNESTDRQWSLHQDSTPCPAIGVMPSFACHGCTQTEQVFTINLGVFVKSFYEAVWGRPLNGFATEADCDVSVRLGALMQGKPFGDANDKWWTINGTPQCNNSLGSEIQSALVGVSLFWTDFSNTALSLNI